MKKKYNGDFGELLKLVEYGKITQEHPYYNLFKYITETNKDKIRRYNIKTKLLKDIDTIKQQINQQFSNSCENMNLQMQPYLIEPYKKVYTKYTEQLNRISELENGTDFNYLLEDIYYEVILQINENDKIVNENIQKKYDSIIKECSQSLNGIKFRGNYLIEESIVDDKVIRKINKNAVKELTEIIGERELEAFPILESFEEKKFKLGSKCLELKDEIVNSSNIVYTYIQKRIQAKIKEYDKKIFEHLSQDKKMSNKLQFENVITIENGIPEINLTGERLRELKITGEIFEILNIRCRLKDIETKLTEKITKEEYKDLSKIIDNIDFETIEPRHVEMQLNILCKQYENEKIAQYNEIIQAISNIDRNKEVFKTPIIKNLEQEYDTNILTIYMPSAPGITTRRNSLYIVKILTDLEENIPELNDFLQNDEVSKLPSNEENIITRTIREYLNKYIKKTQIEKSKTLIKEK